MSDSGSSVGAMPTVPSSRRRGDTLRSSSSASSFHPHRKFWLLCVVVAAVLVVVLVISFVSSHGSRLRHVRSQVAVQRPDDGTVWTIGGYAMKIDPQMLAVVEHDDGAVSIIKTIDASQRDEDNAKTDGITAETGPIAAAAHLI